MASAYIGTISKLKRLHNDGVLIDSIKQGYIDNLRQSPSPSEVRSWSNSIPSMLDMLDDNEFGNLLVLLELRMPIGDERADIILLGKNNGENSGLILELKQWSSVSSTESPTLFNVPGQGVQEHPAAQVLNYMGKLKALHSFGSKFGWKSVVFLHNLPISYRNILESSEVPSDICSNTHLLYKETVNDLKQIVQHTFSSDRIEKEVAIKFDESEFTQTNHFFDVIRNNANDIAENATVAIAETGTGLTGEQHLIVEKVLNSVEKKEENIFLVEGGPGSGKSLVAVHLLLRLLSSGKKSVLALRNNRLMTILRACLNNSYPGASGATIYSSIPRSQRGLGDPGFIGSLDGVVCDEAQRFGANNIRLIMGRAPTVAFFYDESQILNPPEEGTSDNFRRIAEEEDKNIIEIKLTNAIRCRGGKYYHEWVDHLISTIGDDIPENVLWEKKYKFKVVNTINDLINDLKQYRSKHRVAMIASFTESPGKMGSPFHNDNIRIGYPLTSGLDIYRDSQIQIPWLMDPRTDYTPFWLEGGSNKLDRVASIYGCQGFESDYVGIIWGRDFINRNGKWKTGPLDCITDNIDGLKRKAASDPSSIIHLLQNRYRIFLTRGILGTFIFFEDEETKEFVQSKMDVNA